MRPAAPKGVAALDAAVTSAFIAACPDAFVAVNLDFEVIVWNPAAEELFGWTSEEVLGGPPPQLPSDEFERLREQMPLNEVDELPALSVRRRKDGSHVVVIVEREVELRDDDGALLGHGRFLREARGDELRLHKRNELSRDLVEAVRMDDVRAVLEHFVGRLLEADRALVLRPDADGSLVGHLAIGAHQEQAELVTVPSASPAARTATERIVTEGTLTYGKAHPEPAMFVPMGPAASGWVLGLVYGQAAVQSGLREELARALAGEAWAALRRVELVAELEAKVEILEATTAVSGTAGLDLDELLEQVCRSAAAALSCERAAVYLHNPDGTIELAHFYASDIPAADHEGRRAAEEVLRRREPVVVQDATTCAFLDGPWLPDEGAVSVFGLPLQIRDRDIGVLLVAHTLAHPRGFTNLCQQVGDAIARQAALAIDNARLFATERAAVAKLEELDRLKADYIAGITHDLRTPLTGLMGFVKTLRRLDDSLAPEERRDYLETMERQATRLAAMVDNLLTSARLEAGALTVDEPKSLDLAAVVAESVNDLAPDQRARIVVETAEATVCGDRSQLLRVVQNLVDNALKYSPPEAPVEVRVGSDDGQAVLAVRDRGPGIAPAERERLFTRFEPGRRGQGSSTGLGLYIVRGIVEAHAGSVAVESSTEAGTTFAVRLPAAPCPEPV